MKDFIEQHHKEKALQNFKTQFYSGEINCQKMQRQSRFFNPLIRCIDSPDARFQDNALTTTQHSPPIKTVYPQQMSNEHRHILPLSNSIPLQIHQEENKLNEDMQLLKHLNMKLPNQDQNKSAIPKRCRLPTLPAITSLHSKQHTIKTETQSSSPNRSLMSKSYFEPFNFHPYSEVIQTNKLINSPANNTFSKPHSVDGTSHGKRTNQRVSVSEKKSHGNHRDLICSSSIQTNSTSSSKTSLQTSLSPQNSKNQAILCFTPQKPNRSSQLSSHSLELKTNNLLTKQEKKLNLKTEASSPKKQDSMILQFTEVKTPQNHILKFQNQISNQQKIHGKKLILTRKIAINSIQKQRRVSEIVTTLKMHTKDPCDLKNKHSNSISLHDYSKEIDEDANGQYEYLSNYYDAKYKQAGHFFREQSTKGSSSINNEAHTQNQLLFNEFLPWNEVENKHAVSSSKERFNFKSYNSGLE